MGEEGIFESYIKVAGEVADAQLLDEPIVLQNCSGQLRLDLALDPCNQSSVTLY